MSAPLTASTKKERPAPIHVVRRGTFLCPASPMDAEAIGALPVGKRVEAVFRQARNARRLRLYFALLGLVVENLDGMTKEVLHDAVKVRLGYYKLVQFRNGDAIKVPLSIAFDEMDEPEFAAFLDRFLDFIRREVIPGLDRKSFEAAALEMMGEAA